MAQTIAQIKPGRGSLLSYYVRTLTLTTFSMLHAILICIWWACKMITDKLAINNSSSNLLSSTYTTTVQFKFTKKSLCVSLLKRVYRAPEHIR